MHDGNNYLIDIIQVEDKSMVGRIISLLTFSRYSHGAFVLLDTNDIIEMTFKGPRSTYIRSYKWKYKKVKTIEISKELYNKNIKKYKYVKYDWIATIFFYINRFFKTKWGKSDKRMMCIEFIGKVLNIDKLTFNTKPCEMEKLLNTSNKCKDNNCSVML